MSGLRSLRSAAVNADRVLSMAVARNDAGDAVGVGIIYDTGLEQVLLCENPADAIREYLGLPPLPANSGDNLPPPKPMQHG